MSHTSRKTAIRRIARFKERAAELRRKANGADEKSRAKLLGQAEMLERIVQAAERDSEEQPSPHQGKPC
ncbi:MAG: hypothetical protein JO094_15815 [Hyphomicrobiales bacterium]|nr:hypothetical protein [Hyphomicrobiales bacterium]MBV8770353.1 hypothetical protein [Hyphomicrobiales bacterium]MBV9751720.1 hypothetical protein [Hyphomicrobiales bacterium]MBV9975682.1 hypothetical protein [Hyphomicrobiales bacterium]